MSAEEKSAATLKAAKLARAERDLAQRERMDHIAKLRTLRFIKEAADKRDMIEEKAAKARKTKKKPG